MSRTLFAIGAALAIACVIGALYFFHPASWDRAFKTAREGPSTLGIPGASPIAPMKPARTPPEGSKEYRNTDYRFQLFYPENLSVSENDDGGGASTIVLQNPEAGLGFQIFVVPYGFTTITQEQFLKDEPSGVRTNATNATIDGVQATTFFSTNATLGDTAEIWLIKDGYLYEITAPKALAEWLSGIVSTWQFI